jgi:hypothetical protein
MEKLKAEENEGFLYATTINLKNIMIYTTAYK